MTQLGVPQVLQQRGDGGVAFYHVGEFVDDQQLAAGPGEVLQAGEGFRPVGEALYIPGGGMAFLQNGLAECFQLHLVRLFRAGKINMLLAFAEFQQRFGLADPSPAIEHDELSAFCSVVFI